MRRWALIFVVLGVCVQAAYAQPRIDVLSLGPEEAVDQDGDGLLDYVTIPAQVHVDESARYLVSYQLHVGNRTRLSTVFVVDWAPGEHRVVGRFEASAFHGAGFDGHYEVKFTVRAGDPKRSDRTLLAEHHFVTKAYRWEQFADRETSCFDDDGTLVIDWRYCASHWLE